MTDLDKLEALAKAATQGPWSYRDMRPNTYGPAFVDAADVQSLAICGEAVGRSETHGFCLQVDSEVRMANAAFIAAANPATILSLIASARRDAEEIERLMAALKPFHAAYIALVETHCSFEVTGATAAERRFSDGEREVAAKEAAFEALTSITFDQLAAVDAAMTARAAHTGEG